MSVTTSVWRPVSMRESASPTPVAAQAFQPASWSPSTSIRPWVASSSTISVKGAMSCCSAPLVPSRGRPARSRWGWLGRCASGDPAAVALRHSRVARQLDDEGGALSELAVHVDGAAVVEHDAARDGEPEASALAARLGGEEGLEDPLERVRGDARPRIFDPDLDAAAERSGRDAERAATRHRGAGVDEHVEQGSLGPLALRENGW